MEAFYVSSHDNSKFGDIIIDIRRLLGNYSFHAIGGQENEAAHLIARHSRYLSCPEVFDVTSSFLLSCINDFYHDHISNELIDS